LANQPSHFASLATSSNAPPPHQRSRKRQATSSPTGSSESDAEASVQHHCPFPSCCKSFRHGFGGWNEKRVLLTHVATVHIAAGEVPSASWLLSFNRWVCGHCLRLVPQGRKCSGENCFLVRPDSQPSRLPPIAPRPQQSAAPNHLPVPVARPSTPLDTPNAAFSTLLDEILGCSRPLFRHVPRAAIAKWGIAWADVLERLCKERTWEALRNCSSFQKITLLVPKGS